jgi:hypothetical protein
VQALAGLGPQLQLPGGSVGADREGGAQLDGTEDADQPLADAVTLGQFSGHVLLALLGIVEVEDRPAQGLGLLLDVGLDARGGLFGEVGEVLEQDVVEGQEASQAAQVGEQALGAAEADAVEAAEDAVDTVSEAL